MFAWVVNDRRPWERETLDGGLRKDQVGVVIVVTEVALTRRRGKVVKRTADFGGGQFVVPIRLEIRSSSRF